MLQEVQPDELKIEKTTMLVYFYTPLCGTCTTARKMLNIALEAVPQKTLAFSCNLNFAPDLAQKWEITSVPCLLLFHDGVVEEKVYAFHSVSYLYDFLMEKIPKNCYPE